MLVLKKLAVDSAVRELAATADLKPQVKHVPRSAFTIKVSLFTTFVSDNRRCQPALCSDALTSETAESKLK